MTTSAAWIIWGISIVGSILFYLFWDYENHSEYLQMVKKYNHQIEQLIDRYRGYYEKDPNPNFVKAIDALVRPEKADYTINPWLVSSLGVYSLVSIVVIVLWAIGTVIFE